MSRTIEQIFKNSYHVGAHYGRFRILLVTEGGPDFSGSTGENAAVFREYLHGRYFQWILDAFDAAAKEIGLSLGKTDRAEFFTSYNYYWCNTRRSEIPSGERIAPEIYLTRLVKDLNAGLVISAGGVGDERFKRNFAPEMLNRLERPIFLGVPWGEDIDNVLKEIFKIYLRDVPHSTLEEITSILNEEIPEGKSPLDVFNDICGNGGGRGQFNTFPMGEPSVGFFPELLVICEDPMPLAVDEHFEHFDYFYHRFRHRFYELGAFNYIFWWCQQTEDEFSSRKVFLYTDKWTTAAYNRYKKAFQRLAKNQGVEFDFRLWTGNVAPTKIKLPF